MQSASDPEVLSENAYVKDGNGNLYEVQRDTSPKC